MMTGSCSGAALEARAGLCVTTAQACVVILMGWAVTFGFYKLMRWQQYSGPVGIDGRPQGTALWHAVCRIGNWSHIEKRTLWRFLQKIVDGNPLG